MAPPTTKPTDSPEKAKPDAPKPEEHGNNLLSIVDGVKKNAVAPAYNSLAVEPANIAVNVINGGLDLGNWVAHKAGYEGSLQVPKVAEMDTGKPQEGSAAAYSQQIFSTAGSFLSYAIAGKVAGKVMRAGGELMPLEAEIRGLKVGQFTRTLAQDTRIATVLGATAYAGAKDVKPGESRFSNAASTFIGFSAFEAGNSVFVNPRSSALAQIGQRFTVGAGGGLLQTNTASIIHDHKFASNDIPSMLSGGVLNALMPGGNRLADEVAARTPLVKGSPHANEAAARLHGDAARALPKGTAPEPGSWADPKALEAVNHATLGDLHTRAKIDAPGETRIDQSKNLVHLKPGDDPLSFMQEIAHRQIFKDPKYEQAFQSQAAELKSNDAADPRNAAVKEKYVQTRIEQEIAARTAQNQAAEQLNAPRRVSVDANEIRFKEAYGARFEAEANDFVRSGGKTRPVLDHSGPGGGGGGHGAGHAAEHPIQTVSHDHAHNDHGTETHADGPGGGTGENLRTHADGTPETPEAPFTAAEKAAWERSEQLRDWPEVDNPTEQQGTSSDPPSAFHPLGREYYWYNWPNGAKVNGHDNVVWAAHYDAGMNDVHLIKRDPVSNELSAVRLNNLGKTQPISDGVGGVFHASSVEKMFDLSAKDTPINELFDSKTVKPRAIKYEVDKGSELIPSNSTFVNFRDAQVYTIDGSRIFPKSYIQYHDGSGRVDWHQDWPFKSVITEYPEARTENGVSYRVSVPQSIPGSKRLFRLDAEGKPDGGVTDVFAKDHPLDTQFGKALQVDRLGDRDIYHMTDGSAWAIAHVDDQMTAIHFVDGKPRLEDTKVFKGDDGYTETYSTPWGTIFGQAEKVTISPESAKYRLVNGGDVVHFKHATSAEGLDNVDWVYTDPNGDKVVQLADGAQTRVKLPLGGVKTGVAGLENALGVQSILGPGGFTRYHLGGGETMDVIPDRPGVGIIRRPGEIQEIGQGKNGWTSVTTVFSNDKLPVVVVEGEFTGTKRTVQPREKCLDDDGQPIPLISETYKNGLMTKWGLALERHTYWNGRSLVKVATTSKDLSWIELDANGDKVTRNKAGKVVKTEKEPANFPSINAIPAPRRIVNAKDFPEAGQTSDVDNSTIVEDETSFEEDTSHHDTPDDDKLDEDQ